MITVENLGKKYIISHQQQGRYVTLRDVLTEAANKLVRRGRNTEPDQTYEEFWALKDVSFEVKQGERLGIIGRNGAGKSTLLKVLSRITEPTAGSIRIKGRVASLLEVGTGFHPELTGRENIYLNGAILGMPKTEIKRKFDEIVAFAEIEKFLDTPVKRYSSGMYVRLAFSVAAHLEPEILIIDEVLAVGDAQFQKRCLGKMEAVSGEGRTILFVSHNMAAVASLTTKCIELSKGSITKFGQSAEVIQHYLSSQSSLLANEGVFDLTDAQRPLNKVNPKTAKAFFIKACCIDKNGQPKSAYQERESIKIVLYIQVNKPIDKMEIHFAINNILEVRVFSVLSDVLDVSLREGIYQVRLDIEPNYLRPGDYYAGISLYTPTLQDGIKNALSFSVEPFAGGDTNVNWSYANLGVVRFPYKWTGPIAAKKI